jgi:mono/diheme cytochrome c family protein
VRKPSVIILSALVSAFGLLCFGGSMAIAQKSKPKPKPPAKKPAVPAKKPGADIALGIKLFGVNCVACHKVDGKGGAIGPDLSDTGAKHDAKWLRAHIADPKVHTPASTMPAFKDQLKGKDMDAVVAYMVSLKGKGSGAAPKGNLGAKADPAVVAKLVKAGGAVHEVAQNDNRLEIAFNLTGPTVNDAAIAPLASLKRVYSLNLARTSVTDAGLANLKGLTDLVVLHLERTKVSDAGLVHLKGLKSLEYLNLYETQVTDAGLDHLAGLKKLKNIYLWQSKVTKAGAEKLKQALPQCDINLGLEPEAPKPAS